MVFTCASTGLHMYSYTSINRHMHPKEHKLTHKLKNINIDIWYFRHCFSPPLSQFIGRHISSLSLHLVKLKYSRQKHVLMPSSMKLFTANSNSRLCGANGILPQSMHTFSHVQNLSWTPHQCAHFTQDTGVKIKSGSQFTETHQGVWYYLLWFF